MRQLRGACGQSVWLALVPRFHGLVPKPPEAWSAPRPRVEKRLITGLRRFRSAARVVVPATNVFVPETAVWACNRLRAR
jgi:hypothetical protein